VKRIVAKEFERGGSPIPVILKGAKVDRKQLPFNLNRYHIVDLNEGEPAYQQLIRALKG
jgi:hypothetical protein